MATIGVKGLNGLLKCLLKIMRKRETLFQWSVVKSKPHIPVEDNEEETKYRRRSTHQVHNEEAHTKYSHAYLITFLTVLFTSNKLLFAAVLRATRPQLSLYAAGKKLLMM